MAIRYSRVEDCLIFAQKGPGTDEDWDRYVALVRKMGEELGSLRILVVAESGMTPRQRAKVDAAVRPYLKASRFAVVTQSTVARGLVHALRLFIPQIRPFEPADIDSAIEHLGPSAGRFDAIFSAVNASCVEVGLPLLARRARPAARPRA